MIRDSRRLGPTGLFGTPLGVGGAVVGLDRELLAIMVCPESHAPLIQVGDCLYSTDPNTRRRYPMRNGIPVMLIDESEVVEPKAFERVLAEHGVQPSAQCG